MNALRKFRLFPALWHSRVERRAGTVSPAVSANPFRHLTYCTLCGETAAMCECHQRVTP